MSPHTLERTHTHTQREQYTHPQHAHTRTHARTNTQAHTHRPRWHVPHNSRIRERESTYTRARPTDSCLVAQPRRRSRRHSRRQPRLAPQHQQCLMCASSPRSNTELPYAAHDCSEWFNSWSFGSVPSPHGHRPRRYRAINRVCSQSARTSPSPQTHTSTPADSLCALAFVVLRLPVGGPLNACARPVGGLR